MIVSWPPSLLNPHFEKGSCTRYFSMMRSQARVKPEEEQINRARSKISAGKMLSVLLLRILDCTEVQPFGCSNGAAGLAIAGRQCSFHIIRRPFAFSDQPQRSREGADLVVQEAARGGMDLDQALSIAADHVETLEAADG